MNDTNLGQEPTVIVVPANVNRALMRNKIPYSQYLDFEKINVALSAEDIRLWNAINDTITIGGKRFNSHLMNSIILRGRSPNLDSGKGHGTGYYYPTNIEGAEAIQYLQQSNAMTEDFYSLHREGDVIFVVIEEGFSLKLEDNSNKLNFLKTYLKKLCEIMPVHKLAKNPLHLQYVSLVTT